METIIITIRHALSNANIQQIVAGRKEYPLSSGGRKMIEDFVQIHGHISGDIIISSGLMRAYDTAILITGTKKENIIINNLCTERSYGKLEGLNVMQINRLYGNQIEYIQIGGIEHSINPPEGERLEDLRKRAFKFFKFLKKYQNKKIIIVSHQVFLQEFHGILKNFNIYESLNYDISPLEIHKFILSENKPISDELIYKPKTIYKSF